MPQKKTKKTSSKSSVKKNSASKKKVKKSVSSNSVEPQPGSVAQLVIEMQKEKNNVKQEKIFNDIISKIDPLIKRIVNKFSIPGYEKSDLYQEALYAVRFKAISDFDCSRIIGDDFVGFEKFAALCTKRHLSTLLKTSFQNKRATLNTSVSFNSLASEDDENFDMSALIDCGDPSLNQYSEKQEIFSSIISNLMDHLSDFEKKVLALYAQRYSYEEIADTLNRSEMESKEVKIKGVDNALSRIKMKAKMVVDEMGIDPF